MTHQTAALLLIDRALAGSSLDPQHEVRLDQIRAHPTGWYQREVQENGQETAEAQLMELQRRAMWAEFATSVKPIVQGMRDIVAADNRERYTHVATDEALPSPHNWFSLYGPEANHDHQLVSVFLPSVYTDSALAQLFNPVSGFRLQGMTLAVTTGNNGCSAELRLLITVPDERVRDPHGPMERSPAFSCLEISRTGDVDGHMYGLEIDDRTWLSYQLGHINQDRLLNRQPSRSSDGGLVLDFPGSMTFLGMHIQYLGPYLSKVAAAYAAELVKKQA